MNFPMGFWIFHWEVEFSNREIDFFHGDLVINSYGDLNLFVKIVFFCHLFKNIVLTPLPEKKHSSFFIRFPDPNIIVMGFSSIRYISFLVLCFTLAYAWKPVLSKLSAGNTRVMDPRHVQRLQEEQLAAIHLTDEKIAQWYVPVLIKMTFTPTGLVFQLVQGKLKFSQNWTALYSLRSMFWSQFQALLWKLCEKLRDTVVVECLAQYRRAFPAIPPRPTIPPTGETMV